MKNIKILGKTIPVWAIATIALIGTASATLLAFYGQITGTFNVTQAVILDGINGQAQVTDVYSGDSPAGQTVCYAHNLKNLGSETANVAMSESCQAAQGNCDGVSTSYSQIAYFSANDPDNGGAFIRSLVPYDSSLSGITQIVNLDGSISMTGGSGYDIGFYLYPVTLGSLTNVPIKGTGQFTVNLWFDQDNSGEIFVWNGGTFTGVGGDGYFLGGGNPTLVNSGSGITIDSTSSFYATTGTNCVNGNVDYTIAQLQSGACTGITNSTKVYIWLGANGASKISTINGVPVVFNTLPFKLQSQQYLPFGSCYSFAQNIATDTYTVTSQVVPA